MSKKPLLPVEKIEIVRSHLAQSRISKENAARVLGFLEGRISLDCPRRRLVKALFGKSSIVDLENLTSARARACWDLWIESFGQSCWNPYHPDRQPDNYSSFLLYAYYGKSSGTTTVRKSLMYDHTTDPFYEAETNPD